MNILLIHQNVPGQYKHLARWLADTGAHRIVFLTQRRQFPPMPGITVVPYTPDHKPAEDAYGLSSYYEACCATGHKVARLCRKLDSEGFRPDVVIGHCGWGEMLFIKDVWPDAPMMCLFEYFFTASGGLVGFDPEYPASPNAAFLTRARNAVHYMSYGLCDAGHTATKWQRNTFPRHFHDKIKVVHEGVRTSDLKPNAQATVTLGRLANKVTRADEIFTFAARNLEPARGFHIFMRALPLILARRPEARALIIGASDVSYGNKPGEPGGYRAAMEREVGQRIDWERVHFVGQVPYGLFTAALQLSRCHIYLTAPFVLSWSLLEAMSVGATVVASDTAPVREVMEDARTGFLVDFFSPDDLAERVADVLAHRDNHAAIGRAARNHAVRSYDFATVCLPAFLDHLNGILPRRHRLVAGR